MSQETNLEECEPTQSCHEIPTFNQLLERRMSSMSFSEEKQEVDLVFRQRNGSIVKVTIQATEPESSRINNREYLENALQHITNSLGSDPEWVHVYDMSSSCIDGRSTDMVIGTAGGDAGEFLAASATYEIVTGSLLSYEQFGALFNEYLELTKKPYIYMHTDKHFFGRLFCVIGKDESSLASSIPVSEREFVLSQLCIPDHIGCGHLRTMSLRGEECGIRKQLVEYLIRSFFCRMWDKGAESKCKFDVLEDDHQEKAVLILRDGCRDCGITSRVRPNANGTQYFIVHQDAVRMQRTILAQFFCREGSVNVDDFVSKLNEITDQSLLITKDVLSPSLPTLVVELSNDRIKKT